MNYAIELLFDSRTEKHVHSMFLELHKQKISSNMLKTTSLPHITLFVFKNCKKRQTIQALKKFAATTKSFPIRFTKVRTFEGNNGVVFLSPVQARLSSIQKGCLKQTKGSLKGIFKHYQPQNIIFHCTVGIYVAPDKVGSAVQVARKIGLPQKARIEKISLFAVPERRVPKVRKLFSVSLG